MTKTISIDGEAFEVSTPYAAGHPLTEAEAKSLNQTRCENIGNNFRKQVKEAKEKGESLDAVRASLAEYDAKYTFAMGGSPRTPVDPIEREARKIARAALVAKLAAAGKKIKDIAEEKVEAWIDQAAILPEVLKEAKKIVASRAKTNDLVGELSLDEVTA